MVLENAAARGSSPREVLGDLFGRFIAGRPMAPDDFQAAIGGAVRQVLSNLGVPVAGGMPAGSPFDFGDLRAHAQERFRRATGTVTPPPPGPDPEIQRRREAAAAARKTLGIAAQVELTKDVIKERQRKLARKHHPDRGGSLERMQAINAAADILLAQLGT